MLFDDLFLDFFLLILAVFCLTWLRSEIKKSFTAYKERVRVKRKERRDRKKKQAELIEESQKKQYSISLKEFMKIAYKVAYRYSRTEEAVVDGNTLTVTINSQSGLSDSTAWITFKLNGSDDEFGSYTLKDDNPNLNFEAPTHMADKIRKEMRHIVGIE